VVERPITLGSPDDRRHLKLAIALDHEQIAAARRAFEWDVAIVLGLIALVLTAAAALQLRVILQPLTRLGAELGAIRDGRRARFEADAPAEVAPLVEDFNRLLDEQERMVKKARERAGALAHGLKTPLAVMMANNSILLANPDQTVESQRRWVESNQTEARQMLELVNDMLFLARPENSERQQVRQTVDVSALVERNTLQFEAVCFERGMVLEEDIAPGATVQGDENRLQRLVSTLIDNACKYGDSRASVKLSQTGSQIQLAVSNDGAIIPPEDIPHVFDRFYRVDKARVRSEGGVGLGLAIAQEVAREHGGSITVTSSEAAGTTFTATLPH
jgi:signal transduction histidine kinase